MRAVSFVALIVGVLLIPTALGVAKFDHDREVSQLERTLVAETDEHGGALESYFARARAIVLLTANSPGVRESARRARHAATRRCGGTSRSLARGHAPAAAISSSSTRTASARRASSTPTARSSRAPSAGEIATATDLSTDRGADRLLRARPSRCAFGQVHQTRPYVSPDTKEWVVANATLIPQPDGRKRAFVHFEVTVESFRRAMGAEGDAARAARRSTAAPARWSSTAAPAARRRAARRHRAIARFAGLAGEGRARGVTEVDGRRVAYRRIALDRGQRQRLDRRRQRQRADRQLPRRASAAVPLAMLAVALLIIALAGLSLRAARRELESHANTDALTGPGQPPQAAGRPRAPGRRPRRPTAPVVLTMFDLNGFKNYNDTFGHPAGDALLLRLGAALGDGGRARSAARAYRPGRRRVLRHRRRRTPATRSSRPACRALSRARRGVRGLDRVRLGRDPAATPATPPRRCARPTRPCTPRSTPAARPPGARAATC